MSAKLLFYSNLSFLKSSDGPGIFREIVIIVNNEKFVVWV